MTDPDTRINEPTTRQLVKAVVVVRLGSVLTTASLLWFAFTSLFQTCCVSPTPAHQRGERPELGPLTVRLRFTLGLGAEVHLLGVDLGRVGPRHPG